MKADYQLKIGDIDEDGDVQILADDEAGCLVAVSIGENAGEGVAVRDAKRIVKAWNCHDDLVEACEALMEQVERKINFQGTEGDFAEAAKKARVALARARKEQPEAFFSPFGLPPASVITKVIEDHARKEPPCER